MSYYSLWQPWQFFALEEDIVFSCEILLCIRAVEESMELVGAVQCPHLRLDLQSEINGIRPSDEPDRKRYTAEIVEAALQCCLAKNHRPQAEYDCSVDNHLFPFGYSQSVSAQPCLDLIHQSSLYCIRLHHNQRTMFRHRSPLVFFVGSPLSMKLKLN